MNTFRKFSLSLALLCLIPFSFAQSFVSQQNQALLWKIQYQKSVVYLAGSIHALSADYYPLPKAYIDAYNQSQNLVVELNINQLNPIESRSYIQSKMWLPSEKTLDLFLTPKGLKELKRFAHLEGTPYSTLIKMRPWMVIEQLTGYQLQQSEFSTDFGVDQFFLKKAVADNKPILELETLTDQIEAIADSNFYSQIAGLEVSLSQLDDKDYLSTMIDYWHSANHQGLYDFVYQDVLDYPKIKPMMDSLLTNRNLKMADIISLYLTQPPSSQQSYFVVVGALHLSGPDSIVHLMESKGYYPQPLF
jgi:uncharacterized protein